MADRIPVQELTPFIEQPSQVVMTEQESQAVSSNLAEQIYDDMLQYLKDMQGWQVVGGHAGGVWPWPGAGLDETDMTREQYVKKSRLLARREPHAMNAIRMYSAYGGAMRAEVKAREEQAGTLWDEKFWDLPENRPVLGPHRRNRIDRRLLADGELFFSLFPQPDGNVIVRLIDPLEIQDPFVSNPEDADKIIYYKRIMPPKNMGVANTTTEVRTVYYRDLYATDEDISAARSAGMELDSDAEMAEANGQSVFIYHVPFQPLGLRGNGLLFSAISYIENYRNFLQDRATIVRGLATYIRKVVAKGGSKALADLKTTMQSSIASGLGYESNPPDAAGSTWFENPNLTMESTPPATGAGDARGDSRILRQPIATGVGITEANLFGDPSIGNLASQVQMEGPQLRNFQDYQQMWRFVWQDLYNFVLDVNNFTGNRDVDIDFPPIILEPLGEFVNVIMSAAEKSFVPWEESARQILMRIGANDVDDLIDQAKAEKEEKQELAQQQFAPNGKEPPEEGQPEGRNAGRRGKRAAPSGVPNPPNMEIDMSEHGVPVDNKPCPFCEEEALWEAHGIRFCTQCKKSHNPKFVKSRTMVLADASETVFSDAEEGNNGHARRKRKTVRRRKRKPARTNRKPSKL